jgi:RNA polymerase sigma factor (sigma-70 family)
VTSLGTLTDADLVARCRTGDPAAWSALVERFSRYVFAISVQAFRLRESDAEDVFQEVFARTYEHLDKLRDDAAIRPWLAQLTRNLCLDRIREATRTQPAEDVDPGGSDETLAQIDDALTVQDAMTRLGDPCAELLDRFFCRDQSYRVIGDELELPPGTIASRLSRCLTKLRTELEGRNDGAPPSVGR